MESPRNTCYECFRPKSSCMCSYTSPIDTNSKFVLLTHPHEERKVKNATGRLTNLQLTNSEKIVGIDFTYNKKVNEFIKKYDCYVLYPGVKPINISNERLVTDTKSLCVFVIDTTWPRAKKIIKLSSNLRSLPCITFDSDIKSNYKIKQQPKQNCLSTIESVQQVLINFNKQGIDIIDKSSLNNFLYPFEKMIDYQIECIKKPNNKKYRFKKGVAGNLREMNNFKKNPMTNIFFTGNE